MLEHYIQLLNNIVDQYISEILRRLGKGIISGQELTQMLLTEAILNDYFVYAIL